MSCLLAGDTNLETQTKRKRGRERERERERGREPKGRPRQGEGGVRHAPTTRNRPKGGGPEGPPRKGRNNDPLGGRGKLRSDISSSAGERMRLLEADRGMLRKPSQSTWLSNCEHTYKPCTTVYKPFYKLSTSNCVFVHAVPIIY